MVRKDFCIEVKEYIAVIELGLSCLYENIDFLLYSSSFYLIFFFPPEEASRIWNLNIWNAFVLRDSDLEGGLWSVHLLCQPQYPRYLVFTKGA